MSNSRPILGGPDVKVDGNRAPCGGIIEPKPLPYSPPVGPKGQTTGPGIGGTNHGTAGTQRRG